MNAILQRLFDAADNHGEDTGEADHTVGDLQGLLRKACSLMTVGQQLRFLGSDEVLELVEAGARDEFDASTLMDELNRDLFTKQQALKVAGYRWDHHEMVGWFWKKQGGPLSRTFYCWEDAVEDAYRDMNLKYV
ncbi:hypothetical protein [Burkholderia cenocepacia]|uniref:hypothetical protein n=1 Tax=Burkholderia cenocepacia TaxID=95486 RepID=UPI000760F4C1|nr:hypothetical protein [Burkholderia cenocepacia]KWU19173.1 hypothetical protein AS149_13070 [Burkholderia cenocepacia]